MKLVKHQTHNEGVTFAGAEEYKELNKAVEKSCRKDKPKWLEKAEEA
jgi:hypothetical protein